MSGAVKWVLLVALTGSAGWAAYTVKERGLLDAAAPAAAAPDPRLESFLEEAQNKLVAGDLDGAAVQFQKASGVSEADPRVREGLVLVEVTRAEQFYWALHLGTHDEAAQRQQVAELDRAVDRARELIAMARRELKDVALEAHLRLYERRLNTFVVIAFVQIGDRERASGALGARLADHPQAALLKAYVGADGAAGAGGGDPAPALSASASAAPSAATAPTGAPVSVANPRPGTASGGQAWGEHNYEFDNEPTHAPKVKGELELPAPAPAPPSPDTTDLP